MTSQHWDAAQGERSPKVQVEPGSATTAHLGVRTCASAFLVDLAGWVAEPRFCVAIGREAEQLSQSRLPTGQRPPHCARARAPTAASRHHSASAGTSAFNTQHGMVTFSTPPSVPRQYVRYGACHGWALGGGYRVSECSVASLVRTDVDGTVYGTVTGDRRRSTLPQPRGYEPTRHTRPTDRVALDK